MPCFMLTHELKDDLTPERLLAEEKRVLRHLPREIKWMMSWIEPESNAVITHWQAPTSQCVLVELEHTGLAELMPLVSVTEAVQVYPKRRVARAHPPRPRKTRSRERVWSGALAESLASALQNRR